MDASPTASSFAALKAISRLTRDASQESAGREALIRYLDAFPATGSDLPLINALCARFGLYPYMSLPTDSDFSASEALAAEYHAPEALEREGFVFHAEQQRVYEKLLDGQSVILSAPTSFGKSVVIDALVASQRWSNLVLIVPTIALIDETRRRLARFRTLYRLVTHPSETFGRRNIVIMTRERFLELDATPDVDFFMIDEFYKLGTGAVNDNRRTLLNIAWQRLKATGAQYYLTGPNVESLDSRLPAAMHGELITTSFQTVAVTVNDRSDVVDQEADLQRLLATSLEGSTLVFTGSPAKAGHLGLSLRVDDDAATHGFAQEVADWIARNYDRDWRVTRALEGGVAVHTGPLPRSLQRVMVRLFNDGRVSRLVCTSTLIEGVNTAARNVVIFEKKIDSQLIDFFTFSNIRGRAGRMFRHFVGQVITYMPVPEAGPTVVDIPIDTQSDLASTADLVQIESDQLQEVSRLRLGAITEERALPLEVIRRNRGLSPDLQINLAEHLLQASMEELEAISWSGTPRGPQARATLRLGFDWLLEGRQRRGINFNMMWGQLQNARINAGDYAALLDQQERYARPGQDRSDVMDDVLRFQRNWMGYTIPTMLRGLSAIQAEILPRRGLAAGNYEFWLREIESLYLAPGLAELEEYGLPLPLARKMLDLGLSGATVSELLESLLALGADANVKSRLDAVEQWILDDVIDGLLGT